VTTGAQACGHTGAGLQMIDGRRGGPLDLVSAPGHGACHHKKGVLRQSLAEPRGATGQEEGRVEDVHQRAERVGPKVPEKTDWSRAKPWPRTAADDGSRHDRAEAA
jgi:hypothetical protein